MGLTRKKEGIEHIDTNILVRLITRDDEKQLKKVLKLLSRKEKLYVFEDAAMMEVVFVLSGKTYQYSREKIAAKIKSIFQLPNIICNKSVIEGALDIYVKHPKLSFTDCYLAVITDASGETPLWTLDHKLATQCPVAKEL
ncbi:PIN domain-containing protein [Candidatus Saccharibacteria bacterium]|nr:PIN domain-containing protein [Candidatus Saccharibacteria bacterium]